MAKRGPKTIQVDWQRVDDMAMCQVNAEHISFLLGVSVNTLSRACKRDHDMKFGDYIDQKRCIGREALRKKMYDTAMAGDRVMMIWLSKQYLGMAEKTDQTTKVSINPLIVEDDDGRRTTYGVDVS